jgi:GNAT superfamily N-acetyltransferase
VGEDPAGFVAWKTPASDAVADVWELKRLWVLPEARGFGLGRKLTQAVIDRAVQAERKAVYLDTVAEDMPQAHQLYLSMGFVPTAPYNDNPIEGLAYLVRNL